MTTVCLFFFVIGRVLTRLDLHHRERLKHLHSPTKKVPKEVAMRKGIYASAVVPEDPRQVPLAEDPRHARILSLLAQRTYVKQLSS